MSQTRDPLEKKLPLPDECMDVAHVCEVIEHLFDPEGFLAAGTVDNELYAVPAKYNNKGTMWYRPDLFTQNGVTTNPTTFAQALSAGDAYDEQVRDLFAYLRSTQPLP